MRRGAGDAMPQRRRAKRGGGPAGGVRGGGVAVLAHPGRYEIKRTNMLLLLEEFRALGGSAIEVVTGSHTAAQYVEYAKYAQLFGLKASQGSDYHGKGISFMGMGRLPKLPGNCIPVWQDWPEMDSLLAA